MKPAITPTVQSTPTAEITNTPASARPTPDASPTPDLDVQLVQRVAREEEQLKSGHLEATVEYAQRVDSSSSIAFDLGNATQPPRLHLVSTYSSAEGQRTTELIIIGDAYWERIDGNEWVEVDARENVWGQVQGYLPRVAAMANTGLFYHVDDNRLTWIDPARDINVTLQVDVATGVPQQLRRASLSTDAVVIVMYSGWNAPVDIQMPSGP